MTPLKLCAAIPALLVTSACATPGTPPTADSACLAFKRITYAIPPVQPDGTRTVTHDMGNKYDTPETVGEVSEHNARLAAICP